MVRFFNGWELWEKMVFVLGCAIVVVVLLGCSKLTYTHWRLRKLGAIAEKQRQEQALRRELSEKRRPPGTRKEGDVPFGVRAIESGIEVEGVWISRNNSPEPTSSREASRTSSIFEIVPKALHETDLENQSPDKQPQSHDTEHPLKPLEIHPRVVNQFNEALLAEKLPRTVASKQPSRDPSPEMSSIKPGNIPQCPPVSYSRFSNTSVGLRNSQTASSLDGLEAIHRASTSYYSPENGYGHSDDSESSQPSSGCGGGGDSISASAPMLLNPVSDKEKHQSADAALLNERRISQAAETGQLTPRTRRPLASEDWTAAAAADLALRSLQEARVASRSRSASPAGSGIESLPPAIRKHSLPNVTPFTEFVQSAPPSPGNSSVFSLASENNEARTTTPANTRTRPTLASSNSAPLFPTKASEEDESQSKRASFERQSSRESRVLRGHGTGFEILQPGSLNPRLPAEHPMERQRAPPPVSLRNFTRARSSSHSSVGSARKLQRKRRESMDSSTSASSGRKSRNSLLH
ncbi:hypothetical protein K431DRAFT_221640 [Polychaeton citri CBS 116435]|uniref:Uncharacterized protein n=1 Tax=Polychaeton citri CBS 116435 TaxID=1314669 RepID=A0A9P4QAA1_9PEZI|nr:hypothetical protein K431DRAFT_221640 [Polychaeton citri CBS 116435]